MLKALRKNWELTKRLKLNTRLTGVVLIFVMLPIAILGGIVFYNMEQSSIKENVNYMQSTMERRRDSIDNNIDSINMTTQFYLTNDTMNQTLVNAASGGSYSTKEWIDIYRNDVAALERLINNNPVLSGVRYYASDDNVQEMMPVLFNRGRMDKQDWAKMANKGGWVFDYRDNLFDGTDDTPMIGLITPVIDRQYGWIGAIEANMTMKTMFPSMYEDIRGESSCFVTDDGRIIYGSNEDDSIASIASEIAGAMHAGSEGASASNIITSYKKEKKSVISGMYIPELKGTLVSVDDITERLNEVYKLRTNYII